MPSQRRDDFSAATKLLLAQRVGYRCCYPECPTPQTIGAAKGHGRVINLGVAAHITAAAPGGARYDESLSPSQRRSSDNGIWMCALHGKAIDSDEASFEVDTLRKWKEEAETNSLPQVWTPAATPGALIEPDLDIPDASVLRALGLPPTTDLSEVTARLIGVSRADLEGFRQGDQWPTHSVFLGLRLKGNQHRFDARQISAAAEAHRAIIVVAPPGVGKTTTLLQMAQGIAAHGNFVAAFIALPEWSSQPDGFFRSLLTRHAFFNVPEGELRLLAWFGRLVLFLDGWNELDRHARKRCADEIARLRRDYPELGLVLSTRDQAIGLPISGPVVEIDPLDEAQQLEIARALRGDDAEALLDRAWRTPGVRDLVLIPLYLRALAANAGAGIFPTTKEEILRLFVDEHDKARCKAEALDDVTMGFHAQILTGLATAATHSANTNIPAYVANRVVATVEQILVENGQITVRPQPGIVLNALVGQHALIVSTASTYAFQHQQFQEWYASHEVETRMRDVARGDVARQQAMRVEILNWPAWEEASLFACERCSRDNPAGANAVAVAIEEALGIDPQLAAEMIYRSAPDVWNRVRARVLDFAARWRRSAGSSGRPLGFMIRTGRPEFADIIWPLIAHPDSQVCLRVMRASQPFRVSVLGLEVRRRVAGLAEPQRENLLGELAFNGGVDGIELATELTAIDPSPQIRSSVIRSLIGRRAERQALDVLATSPPEVWQMIAERGLAEEFTDRPTSERLRALRAAALEQGGSVRRLQGLLETAVDEAHGPEIQRIVEDADLPLQDQQLWAVLAQLHQRYPRYVSAGLLHRLEQSLALPLGGSRILERSGLVVNEGPLADLVVAETPPGSTMSAVAPLLGPIPTGRLFDRWIGVLKTIRDSPKPVERSVSEMASSLHDSLRRTPPKSMMEALLARASAENITEIGMLAELLANHGDVGRPRKLDTDSELYKSLVVMVERWAGLLLKAPHRSRSEMAKVAMAMCRVPTAAFLPLLEELLTDDLAQWRAARAAYVQLPSTSSDARTSWTNCYRRAFSAIGVPAVERLVPYLDDEEFGFDAACALSDIWGNKTNPVDQTNLLLEHHTFAQVRQRRLERERPPDPEGVRFSEPIFAAVERRLAAGNDEQNGNIALALARIAFGLPNEGRGNLLDRLITSAAASIGKQRLLMQIVLTGVTINADHVLQGLRELLAAARAKAWLLDERTRELEDWLALFAFSDRPEAVFDAWDLVPGERRGPHRLDRLLTALGRTPDDRADKVLLRLAREHVHLLTGHDWIAALKERPTVSAARIVCDLAIDGTLPESQSGHLSTSQHILASAMNCDPEFRAELYGTYRSLPPGPAKTLFSQAIAEVPDSEGILELVNAYIADRQPFGGPLQLALYGIAQIEKSVGDRSGTYYVFSRPLPELRKKLFALTAGEPFEAELAKHCLEMIESVRDMYGSVDTEPRHPDIDSGRPWPILQA